MGWGEKASRFDGAGFLIFFMDVGDDAFMRPVGVSIFGNILYFVISRQLKH